jgi:competence protein ComEA
MATQGERRALMFLAGVALLGAGTRAWRAQRPPVPSTQLDQQIEAVDSVRINGSKKKGRARKPPKAASKPDTAAARHDLALVPTVRIDLDLAPAPEIEKLPGIGPALARRIVSERETKGAFGCLAALDRVKGIGPALLARLDSLVTFSGVGGAACSSSGRER